MLAPIGARNGLVLEVGCGTGLLTKELVAAGHRVVATDASLAMLEIAGSMVGKGAVELRLLSLPDGPLPRVDAIVVVGHPINYLPDAHAIDQALINMAGALRPDGLLAIDVCDLAWGEALPAFGAEALPEGLRAVVGHAGSRRGNRSWTSSPR